MPMAAEDIADMIRAAIPDAEVEITDLAGDGDHYAARVVAESFRGMSRVAQQRAVYAALGGRMGGVLHALQLTSAVPNYPQTFIMRAALCGRRPTGLDQPMTDAVHQRIAEIVNSSDVVLFMKGTPLFPQCGFSSRAVAILDHLGVAYESVDVLQDQLVRQGIKAFSDWPTIPQLYVKGEFVGGSDIMMEMYEAGELQQLMTDEGVASAN